MNSKKISYRQTNYLNDRHMRYIRDTVVCRAQFQYPIR